MRLPVVPLHASGFGVSTAQIGVINAMFYLMAGIFSLPSGLLSDRFGRKRLAQAGALILCGGMFLLFFGRSYPQLAAIYLLLGVGIAAFGPTMMSWVAEISPATHLGRAYGWYTTALFCGLGMGPAAGGALGDRVGYPPVFLTGGVLVAVTVLAVSRYLPMRTQMPAPEAGGARWQANFQLLLANRPLMGCWLVTFGACIIAGTFFTFLPLFAHERGLNAGQIGMVYLVQSVSNALFRIPFGTISDRVGQRKYQALLGIVLVTLAIAGFAPARTSVHFFVAALGMGISMAVAFTSIGALIAETVEPHMRGLAMGGYNSCVYFGLMAGSFGMGPLIEAVGFARGFLLAGVINLPFVVYYAWSMRGYKRADDGVGGVDIQSH
jgi:MFS family permease